MGILQNDYRRLCMSLHDELYMIDLTQTLYFMADDHYTHVMYASGAKFMIPFGLSRIEERLQLLAIKQQHPFIRLGRKYIVNTAAILNVNTAKQQIVMLDNAGKNVVLQISKPVLRDLLNLLNE